MELIELPDLTRSEAELLAWALGFVEGAVSEADDAQTGRAVWDLKVKLLEGEGA